MGDLFCRQFQLLEKELELIDKTIRSHDDITKGIKNWAIVTWTASVGVGLSTNSLKPFLWLTAVIPVLFWLVDASYRRVQRTFIARQREISDFINSDTFRSAAENSTPFSFHLLKMRIVRPGWHNTMFGVMVFRTVGILYVGLAAFSILTWALSVLCL
jgi:hypothetical protein